MQFVVLAVLLAGASATPSDVKRAMDKKLALASSALKSTNGDYYPHEHELDSLLMTKAAEVKKQMAELAKMVDPTAPKPKAALTAAKTEVHESTSFRAARYFAMHGMKKVSHMLHEELTGTQQAQVKKQQDALKAQKADDLVMPDDDDDDNA